MPDAVTGTVERFDNAKGYGFIRREQGADLFVHFKSVIGEGHCALVECQTVEFNGVAGKKGAHAENVKPL